MSSVIRGDNRPKKTKTKTKNNRNTAFKTLPMKSKIWLCSKPYYNVYPRARFKSRLSSMVRVNVILNRTVVVNSDWRFDNRRGSHLQRQVTEVNNQSIIPANDVIHLTLNRKINYQTGCWNVSHWQQQHSYLGLRSPGRLNSTKTDVGIIYQLFKKETHLIIKLSYLYFKEKTCQVKKKSFTSLI